MWCLHQSHLFPSTVVLLPLNLTLHSGTLNLELLSPGLLDGFFSLGLIFLFPFSLQLFWESSNFILYSFNAVFRAMIFVSLLLDLFYTLEPSKVRYLVLRVFITYATVHVVSPKIHLSLTTSTVLSELSFSLFLTGERTE